MGRKKKSEGISVWYALFVYGGILGGWCAILGSLIRFIIDGINYFS